MNPSGALVLGWRKNLDEIFTLFLTVSFTICSYDTAITVKETIDYGIRPDHRESRETVPPLQSPEWAIHARSQRGHLRLCGPQRRGQNHPDPPGLRPAGTHLRQLYLVRRKKHGKSHREVPPPDGRGGGNPRHLSGHDRRGKSSPAVPGAGTALFRGDSRASAAGGSSQHRKEKGGQFLPGHEAAAGHRRGSGRRPGLSDSGRAHQRLRPPGHH